MSALPSLPPGAPSLAEVLDERAFAKPVHALIDGEMLDALVHADDDRPAVPSGRPTIDVRA